eukprot:TRINITY_DN10552_c0_g1_i1.p1 TRINITY_DN10552_c0_g1~~TRINITY_DN10552_c0_g1_i1.p1  ORF type:complete len:337 (+),score=63.09 TRINITY_DN10552_c0_g1_i1:50-1012(+)
MAVSDPPELRSDEAALLQRAGAKAACQWMASSEHESSTPLAQWWQGYFERFIGMLEETATTQAAVKAVPLVMLPSFRWPNSGSFADSFHLVCAATQRVATEADLPLSDMWTSLAGAVQSSTPVPAAALPSSRISQKVKDYTRGGAYNGSRDRCKRPAACGRIAGSASERRPERGGARPVLNDDWNWDATASHSLPPPTRRRVGEPPQRQPPLVDSQPADEFSLPKEDTAPQPPRRQLRPRAVDRRVRIQLPHSPSRPPPAAASLGQEREQAPTGSPPPDVFDPPTEPPRAQLRPRAVDRRVRDRLPDDSSDDDFPLPVPF